MHAGTILVDAWCMTMKTTSSVISTIVLRYFLDILPQNYFSETRLRRNLPGILVYFCDMSYNYAMLKRAIEYYFFLLLTEPDVSG